MSYYCGRKVCIAGKNKILKFNFGLNNTAPKKTTTLNMFAEMEAKQKSFEPIVAPLALLAVIHTAKPYVRNGF